MNLKKTITILTIIYLLLFVPTGVISQEKTDNLMTQAIQLFDNGNFAEAEPVLSSLLIEKPEDFMVNYFYGACRTENNHFTNADLDALIKANQEVSPVDINYYFGVQYHARSNWERALKFYNKYNSTATLSEEEKQKTLKKIQECYDKINPYEKYISEENTEKIIPVIAGNSVSETVLIPDTEIDTAIDNADTARELIVPSIFSEEPETEEAENTMEEEEPIEFQVNSDFTYLRISHFKTENGKAFYEQALEKQKTLEKSLNQLKEIRNDYINAESSEEKDSIGVNILTLENETYSIKKETTELFYNAKHTESDYWTNATREEKSAFKKQIAKTLEMERNKLIPVVEIKTDSTETINPNILLGDHPIAPPVKVKTENDLVYKIQIGAYSKGLPNYIQKLFNKLSLLRKIENYTDENGVVVYTTGNLNKYDDALKMQNQVRREGVEDARVVPYFKGKRITLKEAKELEGQ